MENNLNFAKNLCKENKLRWTSHIMMRILQRGISVDDVKEAIAANDLELYYALADKHNIDLINKIIKCCRRQLEWVLSDKKNLFDIAVYFKIKKYEENKLDFRLVHDFYH